MEKLADFAVVSPPELQIGVAFGVKYKEKRNQVLVL